MKLISGIKISRIIVLFFTVFMIVFLSFRLYHTIQQLDNLQQQLTVSRNTWEGIASEKESLQEELTDMNNQIREAQLTISEAQERIIELTAENEKLTAEISEAQK